MIVKNISPIPIALSSLGRTLMPGEQADLSEFAQRRRDDCFELQDAFRKGNMVCVGVGAKDRTAPDTATKVQRAYKGGSRGSEVAIEAVYKPSLAEAEVIHRRFEPDNPKVEQVYKYQRGERGSQQEYENNPRDLVTVNRHGITTLDPLAFVIPDSSVVPQSYRPRTLPDPKPVEIASITPEQAKAVAATSRYCVGTRTNGRKCSKSPVLGYEYCNVHMPEDMKKEYYAKKKGTFFKD